VKQVLAVIVGLAGSLSGVAAEPLPKPLVTGLKEPTAVTVGPDGRIYIAEAGEFGKEGDGRILVVEGGKAVLFATGINLASGMVTYQGWMFVADQKRVLRIDKKGKVEEFVPEKAFDMPRVSLCGITIDEQGTLYVSAVGALFRVDQKGKVTRMSVRDPKNPILGPFSAGLVMDGMSHLLTGSPVSGELHRIRIADGSSTMVADGFGITYGLVWDKYGRLYVGGSHPPKISVIPRPGDKPILLASGLTGRICLDPTGKFILVPDTQAGTLTAIPAHVPGEDVDESPLPIETAVAFPDLQWTGWQPEIKGKVNRLRPIVLTHAGDGSNRVFVGTQHGVIHVFPNDQKAAKTDVFLDIQDRVAYSDNQNEEGFLGLAFHPSYKQTGEFFVFYTSKKAKLTNIVSRFRVSKDDPNRADPASEEVLLRIEKPYWNHDGGTLCFGPDGYLYLTHGDGGAANDPHKNGQNLKTLLGKVLRIDVDHKDPGKYYAIPKDNPFVDRKDAAGEIWAYGLRNIWRMSFDRKTGKLWAGDVGQNLYEEIDIIEKGGNYGWNLREGLHPFGDQGSDVRKDLIEPIWEYHHDTGKCIIGGPVYRGPRLPELDGLYLYADYVTGKMWALRYDEAKRRVVANHTIKGRGLPILSYGEDEKGEVYFLEETPTGKGIHWFVRAKEAKKD
jgi:glucose/arabinose dehydrogenase